MNSGEATGTPVIRTIAQVSKELQSNTNKIKFYSGNKHQRKENFLDSIALNPEQKAKALSYCVYKLHY